MQGPIARAHAYARMAWDLNPWDAVKVVSARRHATQVTGTNLLLLFRLYRELQEQARRTPAGRAISDAPASSSAAAGSSSAAASAAPPFAAAAETVPAAPAASSSAAAGSSFAAAWAAPALAAAAATVLAAPAVSSLVAVDYSLAVASAALASAAAGAPGAESDEELVDCGDIPEPANEPVPFTLVLCDDTEAMPATRMPQVKPHDVGASDRNHASVMVLSADFTPSDISVLESSSGSSAPELL